MHVALLFSHSVISNSLRHHGLQHTRLPCPSPHPGVCSNSCHWVSEAIQPSSVMRFSSWIQSFPASGLFQISWLFTSGGQSIGASSSLLPRDIQDWFSLELADLISLQFKTLLSLLQHHSSKASILWHSPFFMVQLSHPYMTTGKKIAFTIWTFFGKVMSLLYNMLSRFIIAFLPRSIF